MASQGRRLTLRATQRFGTSTGRSIEWGGGTIVPGAHPGAGVVRNRELAAGKCRSLAGAGPVGEWGQEILGLVFGGSGLGDHPEPGCARSGFLPKDWWGKAWCRIAAARDAAGTHLVNTNHLFT